MERTEVSARNVRKWVKLWDDDDMEVEVDIGRMPELTAYLFGLDNDALERGIATKGFLNFRGYTDNGEPIENNLKNRLELLRSGYFRDKFLEKVRSLKQEISEGEAVAVSD